MKLNGKWIYFIARAFGLIPFKIDKGLAQKTTKSFASFIACGVCFQGLMFGALCHLFFTIESVFPNEAVRLLVIKWELVSLFMKSLISFFFNLWHHNTTIRFVNNIISFKNALMNVYPREDFFDDMFIGQYRVRCVLFIVQVMISLSAIMFLEYKITEIGANLSWMIYSFNHISGLLLPSLFFYVGLIVNCRCLRILNDNFESFVSSVRNGTNFDLAAMDTAALQLNQFEIFSRQFGIMTDQLFHIYGVQILLTLISSSGFALSSVRPSN